MLTKKTYKINDTEKTAKTILYYYKQNVELIELIADKYNVKVYFFWEPLRHYTSLKEIYKNIENNLPQQVTPLESIFKDKKYIYHDDLHFNPLSCKVAAQKIAEVIKKDNENIFH
jgi:hypothetical protein